MRILNVLKEFLLSKIFSYDKINFGDVMINQENVEKLFDLLDESTIILYEHSKTPYLEGLVKTCENILANSAETGNKVVDKKLSGLLSEISEIEFNKEEIRKAFQYACLKGLKHQNTSNQMITPESIGLFFSYLVEKIYDLNELIIFDPLIGSGNLITCLANNLDRDTKLFGVDKDLTNYKLSQALFGMLEYGENVYFQDVLTFKNFISDLIVTDFSGLEQKSIYEILKHVNSLLREDAFLISVIDNSFFDDYKLKDFIYEVKEVWHFFGMIVLPKILFKNNEKSIFILQKIGRNFIKPKKFLVTELPDFNNENEMITVTDQLNDWFEKIDFYRVRENDEKNNGG